MATISSSVPSVDLQSLFGAVPDAVITSDPAGNVEFLNQAAEQLTGYDRATALGRPMAEVLPLASDDGTPIESPVAACLRPGAVTGPFEARLGGQGPGPRVLEVLAAPMQHPDGSIAGVLLIARDVTRARQIARKLSHQATHDALTGLVNRSEFERRLAQALASAESEGATHALGFLDLDGFKRINDACGHHAGDELLQELSQLLRRGMRARDTVARLGGDEFGMLLEHCSPAKAVRIAQAIRKVISDHRFTCGGVTHRVGASIGMVPVRGEGATPTQLLRAADLACYQAKRRGGNRIQLANVVEKPATADHRLMSPTDQPPEKVHLIVRGSADLCPTHSTLPGSPPKSGSAGAARA
ncbi:MAG TPA: diguanylate cyclase [Gemmatimonadales bacterium]|nr:diguanylate cyclase [Gemmatimonadales bacterium]